MNQYLVITIRFLDPIYHGRKEGGVPEWPPSPLRLFQAMIAASANGRDIPIEAKTSLTWLERRIELSPPVIVAPRRVLPQPSGYCLSVPNNAMDIVARAWNIGNYSNTGDASPATHRTMKTVRPTHIANGDGIHYLWCLPESITTEEFSCIDNLIAIARNITSLGWGIDLVVGNGAVIDEHQSSKLEGERWFPGLRGVAAGLRVPVGGTLADLVIRHQGFLSRIRPEGFVPPSLMTAYEKIEYRKCDQIARLPVAAFMLLKPDAEGYRSFDTTRWALTVSGMTRHTTKRAAQTAQWSEEKINTLIMGHGEYVGADKHLSVGSRRFAYIPLPSIGWRGDGKTLVVGPVRRILITCFDTAYSNEVVWARQALSGHELYKDSPEAPEKIPLAMLSLTTTSEKVVSQYISSARAWATVTPVVLPGFDDPAHFRRRLKHTARADEQKRLLGHLNERIDGLIRKAIIQSGIPRVLAENAVVEWSKSGYWRGTEPANRYGVPDHLKRFPMYHVRIIWRDENKQPLSVPGPICIGGGRFYGLGLFAPVDV